MDAITTEKEIAELNRIRRQTNWWRWGATLFCLAWVTGCLLSLNNSVQGLFQPGARQQQFVSALSTNVQRDIVPNVQTIATQTLAQTRPDVEAAFGRVNHRVPEIAQASFNELSALQTSVPQKGEKILSDTYAQMIAEKEQKLRDMFPDANEESIKTLTTNLTDIATERAVSANDKLFSRHQTALNNIVTSMEHIRLDEAKKHPSALAPDWEMALAIMDVVRGDLHEMETLAAKSAKQDKNGTAASAALPARPATVAETTAKETR
jgi:hypothetical protein